MNQPFSRNRRAVSRPMPDAAPVMKIDLRPLAVPIEFSQCLQVRSNIVEIRGRWRTVLLRRNGIDEWNASFTFSVAVGLRAIGPTSDGPTISTSASRGTMQARERA